MKCVAAILAALVAVAVADNFAGYKDNKAREAAVNSYNAQRQAQVNKLAEKVGASSGTFHQVGVPGTDLRGKGYGYAPHQQYDSYRYQDNKGYGQDNYGYGQDNKGYGYGQDNKGYGYGQDNKGYGYGQENKGYGYGQENKGYGYGQTYNGYAPY